MVIPSTTGSKGGTAPQLRGREMGSAPRCAPTGAERNSGAALREGRSHCLQSQRAATGRGEGNVRVGPLRQEFGGRRNQTSLPIACPGLSCSDPRPGWGGGLTAATHAQLLP